MLFKVFGAAELIKSADDNHYDCDDKASSWITDGWNEANDGACKLRADLILSFSKMVFPHQICRLILVEQIYRAQEIQLGHPYHHA